MQGPLKGVRVLDLSRVLTGPYCTMMLADLGAEVIKVERPETGDDTRSWGPPWVGEESHYFLSINRNKKSIALDLKHPQGQAIARQLAFECDVVLENFRPGTASRLGLDYDDLKYHHPRLIYASISGFGQDGPYRDRAAYDLIIQGMGGLMGITGAEDSEPIRVGVAVADIGAGMYAAYAILAALWERERSGQGNYIDVSMMDVQVSWMTYMAHYFFASGDLPPRRASAHPSIVPYQAFPTSDGWINVTIGNDSLWQRFAPLIDLDSDDPRYRTNADRVAEREALTAYIADKMKTKTRDEWETTLRAHGIPCGPVYDMAEVFYDPQVQARRMKRQLPHAREGEIDLLGVPVKFDRNPGEVVAAPPLLGQHTVEILTSMNYSEDTIRSLAKEGAIGISETPTNEKIANDSERKRC